MTVAGDTVTFFATSTGDCARLAAELARFRETLPPGPTLTLLPCPGRPETGSGLHPSAG